MQSEIIIMRKLLLILSVFISAVLISVAGMAQGTLIHYWHFNNFTTAMYFPSITGIAADYSIHDTSKAKILYAPMPGVSSVYPTYEDPYPTVAADTDIYNLRLGQPAGTALRPRNPCDSMYLLFYIPTVHYRNIVLKYESETSSLGHGPAHQVFDYSIDSGATWRTSGLSEPLDSAGTAFRLITVSFTSDSAVNNNAKLVFRITFSGNTTGTSGNNRFDNVTVDGDSIYAVSTITTTPAAYGPFCNSSTNTLSVPFTSVGAYTGGFSVQLSNPDGSFPTTTPVIIGSGLTSPIFAAISSGVTPSTHYRVRVINSSPLIYGSDNGSDITINAPPTAYAVTGGGSYCGGGTGVNIGVANSQSGVSYQLYLAGVATGSAVTGTGAALTIGSETTAGTYTVKGVYTVTPACATNMTGNAIVSVNPAPAAITGTTNVCVGSAIALHDATTGGTWSRSNTNVSIGSTGIVTGLAAGTSIITYTGAGGCAVTTTVNVNAVSAITGTMAICNGASTTLADATGTGTWTSSNTNATIGASSGTVTGANAGMSVITFTSTAGCTATATITINAQPAAITGPTALCASTTISLANTVTGGVWVSSSPATATIGSLSGTVSGVATGTTNITYTMPGGCYANTTVTVSLSPGPILGSSTVCAGATSALSDAVGGGLWTSSSANAIIGSLTGSVTGVVTGVATITYSLGGTSCTVTKPITVNPSPAGITGTMNICAGTTTPLGDVTGGGVWSSGATGVATVSVSGVVSGSTAGTAAISYTSAGCSAVAVVTVNAVPAAIGGPSGVCAGSSITLTDGVSGGNWSTTGTNITLGSTPGSVTGVTVGGAVVTYALGICAVSKTISVNPVPALSGPSGVCVGDNITLLPTITGGTWVSSATGTATVSSGGSVHGVIPGVATITYSLPTGCSTTNVVTVNSIPTAISGTPAVCVNGTTALGNGAGGGVWSIAPTTTATINISSGVVTGIVAGPAIVTYSLGTGCTVTAPITVNPLPAVPGGILQVCEGLTTNVHDATLPGIWGSSTPAFATVDPSSGLVTASSAGVDTITYTIATGCSSYALLTVNPLPPAITIAGYVCIGLTTHFSDAVTGGKWSTTTPAFATVDSTTGIVTGVSSSTPVITYTLPTGCITTIMATVNAVAPTISGLPIVCQGLMTTLSDSLTGGVWTSSDYTIASVGAGAGIVTGVSSGVAVISYTHGGICPAAVAVTVNPLPAPIAGVSAICPYATEPFIDAGGGSWSSSSPSIATVNVAGAVTGVYPGVAIITYTLPTGCLTSMPVTVQPIPSPIIGAFGVCAGYTTHLTDAAHGTWSSATPAVATVNTSGLVTGLTGGTSVISYTVSTGCAATALITVTSVPPIPGLGSVCAWGDTITIHEPYPSGTFTSTLVTVLNLGSGEGMVTTFAPGTASITYTTSTGCFATTTFTVNSLPGTISGREHLCNGLTTTLSDTASGGIWTSGDLSVATAGSSSGIITGAATGIAHITYTLPSGCSTSTTVAVVPAPSMIAGINEVCPHAATSFTDTITGGVWSSSNAAIATVVPGSGIAYGISAGTATITYSIDPTCYATTTITVDPAPTAYTVTGGGNYCSGGIGEDIGLANSQTGISYQLYDGSSVVGAAIAGAGSPLNFGFQTTAGTYFIQATNTTTGCTNDMSGTATININPLPPVFNVDGGGDFCSGSDGVHIGLDGTATGYTYQLYLAGATIGAARTGTGGAIDFGLHVATGTYTIVSTNPSTLCAANMTGTAVVNSVSLLVPAVSVAATPGNTVCAGTSVTFNATPVNGGTTPAYHWMVNSTAVTATGPSYTYTPANGDVVTATLTSSYSCAIPAIATGTVDMDVNAIVTPVVTITASPGTTITAGQDVTLTASASSAVAGYQWEENGVAITGATTSTYLATAIANGNTYTCVATGSGACSSNGSQTVTITVNPVDHTGVAQVATGSNYSVFPNPSKGMFTIKGSTAAGMDEELTIELTDVLGQVVFTHQVMAAKGVVNETISAGTLANGIYVLGIRSANEYKVVHVVIAQ